MSKASLDAVPSAIIEYSDVSEEIVEKAMHLYSDNKIIKYILCEFFVHFMDYVHNYLICSYKYVHLLHHHYFLNSLQ